MSREPHRRVGVYGLCVVTRSLLLTRLSRLEPDEGRWTLPGGGMEAGETQIETLIREFDEETGLVPTVGELVHVMTTVHPANDRRGPLEVIQYVYAVQAAGVPVVREVGGSTAEAAWVDLDDIDRFPLVGLAQWAVTRLAEADTDDRGRDDDLGTIRP